MCVVGMMCNKEGESPAMQDLGQRHLCWAREGGERKPEKLRKNQRRWEWKVLDLHEVFT